MPSGGNNFKILSPNFLILSPRSTISVTHFASPGCLWTPLRTDRQTDRSTT